MTSPSTTSSTSTADALIRGEPAVQGDEMAVMAADPRNQELWKFNDPCQERLDNAEPRRAVVHDERGVSRD